MKREPNIIDNEQDNLNLNIDEDEPTFGALPHFHLLEDAYEGDDEWEFDENEIQFGFEQNYDSSDMSDFSLSYESENYFTDFPLSEESEHYDDEKNDKHPFRLQSPEVPGYVLPRFNGLITRLRTRKHHGRDAKEEEGRRRSTDQGKSITDDQVMDLQTSNVDVKQTEEANELDTRRNTNRVGSNIYYHMDKLLGSGSCSQVYEGTMISDSRRSLPGFKIAVKCIDCTSQRDASETLKQIQKLYREVENLEKVEPHRNINIVGYYGSQTDDQKLYIAFEFCQGTLRDYVKDEYIQMRKSFKPVQVNQSMANGLSFLHSRNIVHRDLKPENIFIVHDGKHIQKVVLGDFGSAKATTESMFSVTGKLGTIGYIAPEAWRIICELESGSEIYPYLNKKTDVFSLGILFYFATTLGKHPYGNQMASQNNIDKGKDPNLSCLESSNDPLCRLLEKMLTTDPAGRPNSSQLCSHPALWQSTDILDFFIKKSDAFEALLKSEPSKSSILENTYLLPNGNWMRNLPQNLRKYLKQYTLHGIKLYEGKGSIARFLLRAIRNVEGHYRDFPEDVQSELGSYPDGHADFWMNVCPKFLMHVYDLLC